MLSTLLRSVAENRFLGVAQHLSPSPAPDLFKLWLGSSYTQPAILLTWVNTTGASSVCPEELRAVLMWSVEPRKGKAGEAQKFPEEGPWGAEYQARANRRHIELSQAYGVAFLGEMGGMR